MGTGHWAESSLKEIISRLESGSRPKGGVNGISEGIPSIGAEHVDSDGGFNFSNLRYVSDIFAKKMTRGIIKQNDILIVKDGATTGKISLVTEHFPYPLCCINEHVFICRIIKEMYGQYVFYYLRSYHGQEQIMSTFHGGAQGGINSQFAEAVTIPIPPLPEQKRIAAKLDAILPKIKAAKTRLGKAPAMLKKFRQSVLAAACSGRLTADWREGKELPEWEGKLFSDVADIKSNLVDSFRYPQYPHIAPDNIEKETGILLEYRTIEDDKIMSGNHLFFAGQILYSKIRPYLSKVVIVDFDGLCSADMYPIEAKCNTKYLWHYMLSEDFLKQSTTAGTRTVLPKINQKELNKIIVPLPPLPEQQEIVRRVEKLFALADSIKEKYQNAAQYIEKLEQALLAKAFRGELAEADANDESAEALLERIRAGKGK
jgi:type I restriction enzyme S subunit